MPWAIPAVIAGSALVGGYAADQGSKRQADSANKATEAQQQMFAQTSENLAPWMQQGRVSLDQLGSMTGPGGQLLKPFSLQDFQQSPAYQFNLQQGQQAIDKASAKRGMYYAPSTLQDVSRFSQGLASNEFNTAYGQYNQNMKNIWDRLYAMSGSGQNAAAQQGAFGTTVGGQIGENMIGAGNAQAAGQIGVANALAGGANSFANYSLMDQYLKNNQRSSVGPVPSGGTYGQDY
jgi:hypothetical protein